MYDGGFSCLSLHQPRQNEKNTSSIERHLEVKLPTYGHMQLQWREVEIQKKEDQSPRKGKEKSQSTVCSIIFHVLQCVAASLGKK